MTNNYNIYYETKLAYKHLLDYSFKGGTNCFPNHPNCPPGTFMNNAVNEIYKDNEGNMAVITKCCTDATCSSCNNVLYVNKKHYNHIQKYVQENVQKTEEKKELDYSFNFVWVNKNKSNVLMDVGNSKEYMETLKIFSADHKIVNFWYDSKMYQNADLVIKNAQSELPKVNFKDVRKMKHYNINTPDYSEIFEELVPVYYRADLLRVIVGCNQLMENPKQIFIFSNLNIKRINYDTLFDSETIDGLKKYNILMACLYLSFGDNCGPVNSGYENSFFMMSYDENLLKAMNTMIIRVARDIMHYIITDSARIAIVQKFQQLVYNLYPNMFKYYYALKFCGKLINDNKLINMIPPSNDPNEPKIMTDYMKYIFNAISGPGGDPQLLDIGLGLTENDIKTCAEIKLHKGFIGTVKTKDMVFELPVRTAMINGDNYKILQTVNIYIPTKNIDVPKSHFGI